MALPFKRVVPWIDRSEWLEVYRNIFSSDPVKQAEGLNKIQVWKCRVYDKLSISIELTRELMTVKIKDEQNKETKLLSDQSMRLLYGMSITRFINQLLESNQDKKFLVPLHKIAKQMNVPRWLVDLRHESTHQLLPSLQLLRAGADQAISYLKKNYWMKMMYPISLKNKSEFFENNIGNISEVAEPSTEDDEDDDENDKDSDGSTNLAAYKVYHVSNETPDGGGDADPDDDDGDGDNFQNDGDQESYDDYIISSVHFLLDRYIESCDDRSSVSCKGRCSSATRDVIDKLELFLHIDKNLALKNILSHQGFLSSFSKTDYRAKMWLPLFKSFSACRLSSRFIEMVCMQMSEEGEESECLSSLAVYFIENSFKLSIDGRKLIRLILTRSNINSNTLKLFRCLLSYCRPHLNGTQKNHLTSIINIWNMQSTSRGPVDDIKVNNHNNLDLGHYEDSTNRMADEMTRFHTLSDFEKCLKNRRDQPVIGNECDTCCGDQVDNIVDDFTNDETNSAVVNKSDDYFVPAKKQKFSVCSGRKFVLLDEFDINKTPLGYTDASLDLPEQLNVLY